MSFKFIALSAITLISFGVKAQITSAEHEKYWFYRSRLEKEFMIKGTMAACADPSVPGGYSLPAEKAFQENDYSIVWSDETMYLGLYIGVLATEFKLLKDKGEDTYQTELDLYFAMNAYKRLDARSSSKGVDKGTNCLVNGYFIRGDAEEEIFEQNPVFDKYLQGPRYSGDTYSYKSTLHDINRRVPADLRNITPDQVNQLLVGFALVKKCYENFQSRNVHGLYFYAEAIKFAENIANSLEANDWRDINESGQDMGTGDDANTHETFRKEGHSYNTAKAASFISPNYSTKDFLTGAFTDIGILWQKTKLQKFHVAAKKSLLKDYAVGHLAAGVAVGNTGHDWKDFSTHELLEDVDNNRYDFGLYKLLMKYLYNEYDYNTDYSSWFQDLKDAPCYGIQYKPSNMSSSHAYYEGHTKWQAPIKWTAAQKDLLNRKKRDHKGKFNGLDYMLFYNLYNLYFRSANLSYVAGVNELSSKGNIRLFTSGTLDENIYSYSYIEAAARLNTIGSKYLSAESNITLRPGFSFTATTDEELTMSISQARNACGDALDQYGELLNPETGMSATAIEYSENYSKSEEVVDNYKYISSFTEDKNYKPIDEYLRERKKELEESQVEMSEVKVYPNPFDTEVNIFIYSVNSNRLISIELYDKMGRKINTIQARTQNGITQEKMELSDNLPKGTYYLKVSASDYIETIKIIKK